MNYASLAASATRAIQKYGRAVTLSRRGTAALYTYAFDPVLGDTWTLIAEPHTVVYTDPGEVALTFTGHAVEHPYEQNERDGTLVMAQDRRYLLEAAIGTTPLLSDRLIVGSDNLAIVNIEPLSPGGTVLLYEVQCRG